MRARAAGILLFLATGLLLPARPLRAGDEPAPGNPDPALQKKIDEAIARGVEWLRTKAGPDGGFRGAMYAEDMGPTALAVYTLRSCGAPSDDPAVASGFDRLREEWVRTRASRSSFRTYSSALTLLALEAHRVGDTSARAEQDSARAGSRVPEKDLAWARELVSKIHAAQGGAGGFGYGPETGGWNDLSNTQFALLGLKAASRLGAKSPPRVFRAAMSYVLGLQEGDGPAVDRMGAGGVKEPGYGSKPRVVGRDKARGFSYQPRRGRPWASGSMTAAGVASLVICRSELIGTDGYTDETDAKAERGIRDGLAWLGLNFSVSGNPIPPGAGSSSNHYYYLYGLERAGVLAGVATMGKRAWYPEGAEYLVEKQRTGGAWDSAGMGLGVAPGPRGRSAPPSDGNFLDSCFALLFLRRATFRVARGAVTVAAEDSLDLTGAASLDDRALADLFGAVFRRYAGAAEDRRADLAAEFVRLGRRAVPLLVLALEEESLERRAAAADALRRTTGESHGYEASGDPAARAAAVARWEEWWNARRDSLEGDAGAGKFVVPRR